MAKYIAKTANKSYLMRSNDKWYKSQYGQPELLYTMSFDGLVTFPSSVEQDGTTHKPRIVYGGDAAGWTPVRPTFPADGAATFTDASGLNNKWPFNEIKPCLMRNAQIIGYLKPDDFSKFEDGTPADITSGDYEVMIQFPKIYWKLEQSWDGIKNIANCTRNNYTISVSNVPREGFVCYSHMKQGEEYDYIYVGAYESHIENGNLYCCSGKLPTSDANHIDILKNWANYRGSEYTTLDYHFTTYFTILCMLYFGEYYGYTYLGNGWISVSPSWIENSGVLNTAGMFYGSNSNGTYNDHVGNGSTEVYVHNKLFGLENIWGHSKTYVDGLLYNETRRYLIIDPTNPNAVHNLLGTNYNEYYTKITQNFVNTSWATIFLADNDCGFLPVANSTSVSNQIYWQTRVCQYRPSSYRYFSADAECPYMMFTFGGEVQRFSGNSNIADRDFNKTDIYHNERIMCYPASKKSSS